MSEERWAALREAYAAGRVTVHRETSVQDRYVRFEDGTLWFPDGRPELEAGHAGPAALFGAVLLSGSLTVVLCVDGHPWALPSLLPLGFFVAALTIVVRRGARAHRAAELALERGVFLCDDTLVLRDPPFDERMARADIIRFAVHRAHRGGEASRPWIHVVKRGEDRSVPLDLTEDSLPELEAWLASSSPRRKKRRRKGGRPSAS
ncbi:MAG: hypothetical protein AAF715_14760 [Myxococcota bacterium]